MLDLLREQLGQSCQAWITRNVSQAHNAVKEKLTEDSFAVLAYDQILRAPLPVHVAFLVVMLRAVRPVVFHMTRNSSEEW